MENKFLVPPLVHPFMAPRTKPLQDAQPAAAAAGTTATLRWPVWLRGHQVWLFAAALLAVTFAVYSPVWHGGMLWDDDFHLTRPDLRSLDGLARIWSQVGATLQYYPLLHSVFWVEHQLWGDATLGYHLVTILMHVTAALLLATLLRRLEIPGAWLAAAIFALHPVQVESVAWMTELKNTLSTVFYFGAALLYLRFDACRRARWYLGALAVFVAALLSKTVTGTLPAALLLVFWWKRGRLRWRADVWPLLPFLALGAGFGILTGRWELVYNHCVGPDFEFTPVERLLIAGRAAWFQLSKLVWPSDLAFIYPRWSIDAGAWWQFVFPLGAVAVVGALWAIRRRSRAPLAAALFYGGTLFPTLGFFNLYTFRYSFVANHYQYVACAGIITLACAGAARLRDRLGPVGRRTWLAAVVAVVTTLAGLTWAESRYYADAATLYRVTLDRDPSSWLAHTNLGALELDANRDDAMTHLREAIRLKPDLAEAHANLGNALQRSGRGEEATAEYERALSLNPALPGAQSGLAAALLAAGRTEEAASRYDEALRLRPGSAELHRGRGDAWRAAGRPVEGIGEYSVALQFQPDDAETHSKLGDVLQEVGRLEEALVHYDQARPSMARNAAFHNNFGTALEAAGRGADAESQFLLALELQPEFGEAHFNLANLLTNAGRSQEGARHYLEALRTNPGDPVMRNNLGVALIQMGRPTDAAVQFAEALRLKPDYGDARANLARANAALGKGRSR